jgi:hypothetical protein
MNDVRLGRFYAVSTFHSGERHSGLPYLVNGDLATRQDLSLLQMSASISVQVGLVLWRSQAVCLLGMSE